MSQYQLGDIFPAEEFVQKAIEGYFEKRGFALSHEGHIDLVAVNNERERWHIEAKGKTAQVGLDFRTGLGQIVQRIITIVDKAALAMPDIPSFAAQCKQVSPLVRQLLNLHWIFVRDDGSIRVVLPNEEFL